MARSVEFSWLAFDQLEQWNTFDRKLFAKVLRLIQETKRTPFEGTGKPELLKHEKGGAVVKANKPRTPIGVYSF
jgi:toxin YoeB